MAFPLGTVAAPEAFATVPLNIPTAPCGAATVPEVPTAAPAEVAAEPLYTATAPWGLARAPVYTPAAPTGTARMQRDHLAHPSAPFCEPLGNTAKHVGTDAVPKWLRTRTKGTVPAPNSGVTAPVGMARGTEWMELAPEGIAKW